MKGFYFSNPTNVELELDNEVVIMDFELLKLLLVCIVDFCKFTLRREFLFDFSLLFTCENYLLFIISAI